MIELDGEEFLFYRCRPINVALLRWYRRRPGRRRDDRVRRRRRRWTRSRSRLAIRASAGPLVAQDDLRLTTRHVLAPRDVQIPGICVDGVVVARDSASHMQTFAEGYNPAYTGEARVAMNPTGGTALDVRRVIARRAAMQLKADAARESRDRDPRGCRDGGRGGGDPRSDHAHG